MILPYISADASSAGRHLDLHLEGLHRLEAHNAMTACMLGNTNTLS